MNFNNQRKRQLSEVDDNYVIISSDKRIKLKTTNIMLYELYCYLYKNYNENVMRDIMMYTYDLEEQDLYIHNKNIDTIKKLLFLKLSQSQYSYVLDIPKIIRDIF